MIYEGFLKFLRIWGCFKSNFHILKLQETRKIKILISKLFYLSWFQFKTEILKVFWSSPRFFQLLANFSKISGHFSLFERFWSKIWPCNHLLKSLILHKSLVLWYYSIFNAFSSLNPSTNSFALYFPLQNTHSINFPNKVTLWVI